MSLSPPEYIRHILDEIDYILSRISDMDYESFEQRILPAKKLQVICRQGHNRSAQATARGLVKAAPLLYAAIRQSINCSAIGIRDDKNRRKLPAYNR